MPGPDEKLLDVLKTHRQSMSLGGNLVQAPAESPAETVLPEVVEPQEPPSAVSGSENVEVQELAHEITVVAPEPEVEPQEPALTEAQDITIHPQPAVEEGGPETLTEQTPVTITEPELAPSVLPDEPEVSETNILPEAATSEQPDSTVDAPIEPVTASKEESVVIIDEEPAKDAPIPAVESSPYHDEEPAKDAPVPVDESPAPQIPVETLSTLQAPPQPTERRGSSVLARVRAMESPKPPGSFD